MHCSPFHRESIRNGGWARELGAAAARLAPGAHPATAGSEQWVGLSPRCSQNVPRILFLIRPTVVGIVMPKAWEEEAHPNAPPRTAVIRVVANQIPF